ncbi:glycosyltransferase [Halobacteriales archaeon Cl-PHB]
MSKQTASLTVSAIITSYNDAKYVGDAIESVLNQTQPVDELVIVDGGSTDGTRDIVSQYDTANLIVERGTNLPQARNKGIEHTNGDLVAFLDADDMWLEEKVERQVSCFTGQAGLGLVYTNFNRVTPNETFKSVRNAKSLSDDQFLEQLFVRGAAILPSTAMVRRECFNAVGTFDERLAKAEERDMWLRIGAEWQTRRIGVPLVNRRERADSLGTDTEERYEYEQLITEKLIKQYPSLSALRDKREAHLLYRRGTFKLLNERSGVRRDLVTAIRLDPTLAKAYFRLGLTVLPTGVGQWLSHVAREIKYQIQ